MFVGLDKLPWKDIQHAYGTCERIPALLRRAASGDADAFARIVGWLDNCCFHQETQYQANGFLLPFLLELVASSKVPHRERILVQLQAWIASDRDSLGNWNLPPRSPAQIDRQMAEYEKESLHWWVGCDYWRHWQRQTMQAAWNHRQRLLDMLQKDPSSQVRTLVATMLGELVRFSLHCGAGIVDDRPTAWYKYRHALSIAKSLARSAKTAKDPAVRVASIFALGVLRELPEADELSRELFTSAATRADKTATAACCFVGRRKPTKTMCRSLLTGIIGGELADEAFRIVPWLCDPRFPIFQKERVQQLLIAWVNASPHGLDDLFTLLQEYASHKSATDRSGAFVVLGALERNPRDCVKLLRAGCRDKDPLARARAAHGLWKQLREADTRPLVKHFRPALKSDATAVRKAALTILGEMSTDDRVLSPQVEDEQDQAEYLATECRIIGGMPKWFVCRPLPMAAPLLLETAEREQDLENCELFCDLFLRARVECGNTRLEKTEKLPAAKQVRSLLLKWLSDGDFPFHAIRAFREVSSVDGALRLSNSESKKLANMWKELIDGEHPRRHELISCLGSLKPEHVLPTLIELLDDADVDARARAIGALRRIDSQDLALSKVLSTMFAGNGNLLETACHYIGMDLHGVTSKRAARLLLSAFEDDAVLPDGTRVRRHLYQPLAVMRSQRTAIAMTLSRIACLDKDSFVRRQSAYALADHFKGKALVSGCDHILKKGDAEALCGLLEPFGQRHELPEKCRKATAKLIKHQDFHVRAAAIQALRRVPDNSPYQRAVFDRLCDDGESEVVQDESLSWHFSKISDDITQPMLRILQRNASNLEAWWTLKDQDRDEPALAGAKLCLLYANDELVFEVCDWITNRNWEVVVPDVEAEVTARLSDTTTSSIIRLKLLETLFAVKPRSADKILRELKPLESHRLPSLVERAGKLREHINSVDPEIDALLYGADQLADQVDEDLAGVVALLERALAKDPNHPKALSTYAVWLGMIADDLYEEGKHAEALQCYGKSTDSWRRLFRWRNKTVGDQTDVNDRQMEELFEEFEPAFFYDEACCAALTGDVKRAVKCLAESFAYGFEGHPKSSAGLKHCEKDKDLASIRDDPDCQKLLRQLRNELEDNPAPKAKVKPMPKKKSKPKPKSPVALPCDPVASLSDIKDWVSPPKKPLHGKRKPPSQTFTDGTKLEYPPDYVDLIEIYGTGKFESHSPDPRDPECELGEIVELMNPRDGRYLEYVETTLGDFVGRFGEVSEHVPFGIHPTRPGLFPWGRNDNGTSFLWLTEGSPKNWPVIVYDDELHFRFEMPMTVFLERVFLGKIDCDFMGYPVKRFKPGGIEFRPFARPVQ